jgi:hypothetical protein
MFLSAPPGDSASVGCTTCLSSSDVPGIPDVPGLDWRRLGDANVAMEKRRLLKTNVQSMMHIGVIRALHPSGSKLVQGSTAAQHNGKLDTVGQFPAIQRTCQPHRSHARGASVCLRSGQMRQPSRGRVA